MGKVAGIVLVGLGWLIVVSQVALADGEEPTARDVEHFESSIRPLLQRHCYGCHSATAEKLQAGLHLDSRAGMLQGGDSGPAIVPGSPDDSLLLQAVRYESFEMPPTGQLRRRDIRQLEQWIEQGAPWPDEPTSPPPASDEWNWRSRLADHWAWQPARVRPHVEHSVDGFLEAAMAARGLSPAAEAPRPVLIRRVWFDLIGLPPTSADIDRWTNEPSARWYELMVDELLASPHFGEKWARHWLDLVRYGDSCGHEFDYPIDAAYRYRDYVIRAWNADVPYDQFVREHVAGDLMPVPRRHPVDDYNESIIGTGFWFLGESVHAPTDVRGDEADRVANQIDVFSKTFLGMTVACARCHDHKFDPIPTEDYYALAGYLQSSRRQKAPLDPHRNIQRITSHIVALGNEADMQAAAVWSGYSVTPSHFRQQLDTWSASRTASPSHAAFSEVSPTHPLFVWSRLQPCAGTAVGRSWADSWREVRADVAAQRRAAEEFQQQSVPFPPPSRSGGWTTSGLAFDLMPGSSGRIDWFQPGGRLRSLDLIDSGRHGLRQQGVLRSPTFTLEHRRIHHRLHGGGEVRMVVDGYYMREFHELLFADCSLPGVNTQGKTSWVTQARDLEHYVGHRVWLEYHDVGNESLAISGIRLSDGAEPADPPHPWSQWLCERSPSKNLAELTDDFYGLWSESFQRWRAGQGTAADAEVMDWWLRLEPDVHTACAALHEQIVELDRSLPAPMYVLAMADGTSENEHVFIRGNHANLGDEVPRRLPIVLAEDTVHRPATGSGRLAMARQLTHSDRPLLRRVIVNRLWHYLFGRGIVPTVDDMGVMGQPPSHPELLDWLAEDHVRHGWSLKHTIRTIICSAAYRRSSRRGDAGSDDRDPTGQWLSRYPRRRLSAEAIRDAMLCISGSLDPGMYGPSVPIHLTPFLDGRGRPESGPLDGAGRRSIYLSVRRNFLSPMMLAFDTPIPFTTMGRRNGSNVPAQALLLMNDPFVVDQAERWSQRLRAEHPVSQSQRLEAAFLAGLGRNPTPAESTALLDFVATSPFERAWRDVCHLIFNMKDFIYLE